MKIEVSHGEILDKFSILEIKKEKCKDIEKLANIATEYNSLKNTSIQFLKNHECKSLYDDLLEVNLKLWDIEDDIRICEKNKIFDERFIELARSVYFTNDKRAAIKKKINLLLGSNLVEEKVYEEYE